MLPKLETPTYLLTIPSTGEEITFRPFLVKEHKILLTLKEADENEITRVLRDLVDNCTFKKIDTKSLTYFDIEYIFVNLRAKSIGEEVDIYFTCSNCTDRFETSINLLDAKVSNLDKTNKIKINDQYGVVLKYPELDELIKLSTDSSTEDVFNLVIKSIQGVYDETNYWDSSDSSEEEISEFIESLTQDQFKKIEEFFTELPRVFLDIDKVCEKCGHENNTTISGVMSFFI